MTVTLDSLKKSFGKKKVNTQAFAWLADFEREAGDLDTALQRIDGGLVLYPSDIAARLVRTKILFEKEEFEACIEECNKVLKIDPFCLSAQKRMGDAYDKMEMTNERNQCYRKVHDMDPLDQFWKDEYEGAAMAAGAVAAGAELGEMDLSMPGLDTQDSGSSTEFSLGSVDEAPFFEKSPEDTNVVEEKGPKFGSGFEFVNEESNSGAEAPSASFGSAEESESSAFSALGGSEDDPFAALSALIPDADAGEEAAMDSLQASLDSAMDSINAEEPSAPEVFPSDDDISGTDVNSAMSNFFGVDDDLEPEEPAAPASPFSNLNLSAGIDDEPAAAAETNANMVFGTPAAEEDKPQSVDSAFNDIFGEDELPEEPGATAAPAKADQPQSVDSAFNDIFGEDELPEEPGMFQKSAESEPAPAEEPAEEIAEVEPEAKAEPAVAEQDKPQSVDSAFNDIFGEDELPEESGLFQKSAAADMSFDDKPEQETAPEVEPAAEPVVEETAAEPAEDLTSLSAEAEPTEDLAAEPAEELAVEPAAEPKDDTSDSVAGAFDSIFGDADDDLPTEDSLSLGEAPAEPAPAEDLAVAEAPAPVEELSLDEAPAAAAPEGDALAEEMGGAFDSLFGNEDENTGAAIEEKSIPEESLEEGLDKSFDNLFGSEDDVAKPAAEAVEEKPETPAAPSGDLDNLESEVSGAFKGLFESDDDDLPEEKPSNKGVDFLMSGDSDDEVSAGLIKDSSASLDNMSTELDESLNTRTLAEIYLEQGLYNKALEIYQDLAKKEPDNQEIQERMSQVQQMYKDKFGE